MAAQRALVQLDVAGARRHGRLRRLPLGAVASQRHGQQREEERAEDDLDTEPEPGHESAVSYARPSAPKPFDAHSTPTSDEAGDRASSTSAPPTMRPCSSVRCRPEALEQGVALADPHARVGSCEDAELDDLCADQRQRDEAEHRVDLPRLAENVDRAGREDDHAGEPEEEEDASRARGRASSGCTGA